MAQLSAALKRPGGQAEDPLGSVDKLTVLYLNGAEFLGNFPLILASYFGFVRRQKIGTGRAVDCRSGRACRCAAIVGQTAERMSGRTG